MPLGMLDRMDQVISSTMRVLLPDDGRQELRRPSCGHEFLPKDRVIAPEANALG